MNHSPILPVVECSACHKPYVLRLAFNRDRMLWEYGYAADCKCRQGFPAATGRSGALPVLDRIAAAEAARHLRNDDLSARRKKKGHQ